MGSRPTYGDAVSDLRVLHGGDVLGRRQAIVRAAIDLFAAQGYGGASLRTIGAAAGIEKGHLTYYFRAKDDLLFEIVDDLHERFVHGVERWPGPPNDDPELRLRRLFHAHAHLVCELRLETRVAYESFRFLAPERRALIVAKRDRYERGLGELIDACRAGGDVADTPTPFLTKVVLGILNWPYHWFSPTGDRSLEQVGRIVADRARAALAPNHTHG